MSEISDNSSETETIPLYEAEQRKYPWLTIQKLKHPFMILGKSKTHICTYND